MGVLQPILQYPAKGFKFYLSDEIYWKWKKDEALLAIIEGELGVGKSSCVVQMLIEFYGDKWTDWLVYKPEDFLNLIDRLISQDPPRKVPLVVWDDAGVWLYSMEYQDERVKSVVKFVNVMRTVIGGLILTTPSAEMIVKKIPALPGARIGTVSYTTTADNVANGQPRRRLVIGKLTKSRWGKKWVQDYIEDYFNVYLPMDVYKIYKPLRDSMAREANVLMRQAWAGRLIPEPTHLRPPK